MKNHACGECSWSEMLVGGEYVDCKLFGVDYHVNNEECRARRAFRVLRDEYRILDAQFNLFASNEWDKETMKKVLEKTRQEIFKAPGLKWEER